MKSTEEELEDVGEELLYHYQSEDEAGELIGEKSLCSEGIPLIEQDEIIVYKRRWLMLLIFSLNTAMNGCLFMNIAAINNIVSAYYNVPFVDIEWLSNMCVLTYVVLAMPSSYLMARFGIRPILYTAAFCNCASTAFHLAGYQPDKFHFVLLGQVFTAIAYSTILQMPGKLSSLWFPEGERATATAIGVVMNLFGVAIGFLQPSTMVRTSSDVKVTEHELMMFYLSQVITSTVIFLITLAYQEKPPSPPCRSAHRESMTFVESLKALARNKYFISLSQSYGIYFAQFVTIFVLVNPLMTSKFKTGAEVSIGWMGFWNNIVSIAAFIFIGRLLDRYRKYQLTAVLLNFFSMIIWLAFVQFLTRSTNFTALYAIYVVLGIVFLPYFAVGIEQAAEMTYPVSEETSSTVMLVLGNLYAFAFIYVLGLGVQGGYTEIMAYIIVAFYFISTLLASIAKTELYRLNTEKGDC